MGFEKIRSFAPTGGSDRPARSGSLYRSRSASLKLKLQRKLGCRGVVRMKDTRTHTDTHTFLFFWVGGDFFSGGSG